MNKSILPLALLSMLVFSNGSAYTYTGTSSQTGFNKDVLTSGVSIQNIVGDITGVPYDSRGAYSITRDIPQAAPAAGDELNSRMKANLAVGSSI